jgi:hypothetical protein
MPPVPVAVLEPALTAPTPLVLVEPAPGPPPAPVNDVVDPVLNVDDGAAPLPQAATAVTIQAHRLMIEP